MLTEQTRIAMYIAHYFEDLEFWYPYYRLIEAGAVVKAVGPDEDTYTGKHGLTTRSDLAIHDTEPGEYDALVIPGGYAPDHMRRSPRMIEFVRELYAAGKPVAAICHGPWMLASAGIIEGRTLTSFHSIRDDLVNAGAVWVDEPVVSDHGIITSRSPKDLPVFCKAIIAALVHEAATADER